MAIKKFVLIKRVNNDREEIIRSKKVYLQALVAGSIKYTQLTELEYIDENQKFVLFNERKKIIQIQILANEDSEEDLLPLCSNNKRPTIRKNYSDSPVATKVSKRVHDKAEEEDCIREKKRLSDAKQHVVESSDHLYLSDPEVIINTKAKLY
ncbi:uncharacterized protein LOC123261382 [Cotesia glomerata]|uniref:uncharacterized protein LOC123261382 n=1 Tax=Cotesia glomerata TaxID=32391 RepID=UPI001D02CC0F|nr:uncharacterized protein LOC123261382 [Cotesia glomerata]